MGLNRLLPSAEGVLCGYQYAYRRTRGADAHLPELYGSASQSVSDGKFAYLSTLDVEGALDAVPHERLMRSLVEAGVERYILRYVDRRPARRFLRVKLGAPARHFVSVPKKVFMGGARGGGFVAPHVDNILQPRPHGTPGDERP